jgi:hypothetical protein
VSSSLLSYPHNISPRPRAKSFEVGSPEQSKSTFSSNFSKNDQLVPGNCLFFLALGVGLAERLSLFSLQGCLPGSQCWINRETFLVRFVVGVVFSYLSAKGLTKYCIY